MDRPQVFFWQNMPAHHQVGALEVFASRWGAPVTGVWNEDIARDRRAEGWRPSPRRALRDVFLPASGWEPQVDRLIEAHASAIHVFSGIGAYPPTTRAAKQLLRRSDAKAALIVETLLKSKARRLPSFLKGLYHYYPVRRRIGAVMAIGTQAEACYRSLGFRADQIHPYLYQCDAPPAGESRSGATLRLAYLGRLAADKGLAVALAALAPLASQDWTLDIYGKGPDEAYFRKRAAFCGLADKVRFRGVIPSDEVVASLAGYDLCLLPSRYDGWGMAVSEAVQAGIPSLVSLQAGSADLVVCSGAGEAIDCDDVAGWTAALSRRLASRSTLDAEKKLARAFAPRVSPETVGNYLVEVMEHAFLKTRPRPTVPWRRV